MPSVFFAPAATSVFVFVWPRAAPWGDCCKLLTLHIFALEVLKRSLVSPFETVAAPSDLRFQLPVGVTAGAILNKNAVASVFEAMLKKQFFTKISVSE